MEQAQRRDFFRLEASSTPDWVRVLDERGQVTGALDAHILDVSATGLRLHVRNAVLQPGWRVAARFRVGVEAFATRGHVVWTDVSAFSKTQLAGVRFDPDEHQRQRLVHAIHDEQRDQLQRRAGS